MLANTAKEWLKLRHSIVENALEAGCVPPGSTHRGSVMLLAGAIGALLGLGFGMRWRVLALVPLHAVGLVIAIVAWLMGAGAWAVVAPAAVTSLGCNVGYLIACVLTGPGRTRGVTASLRRAQF